MQFTIRVGKEEVTVKVVLLHLYEVTYKGDIYLLAPKNHGHKIEWILKSGTLPAATIKAIGKGIERYIS